MLLNLNSKFKFFLTTTFLFSSPDTLALHLSVSIDDKESPISESLIIKDVISIGVVPFNVMRTELPPEFNGAVNGIPEDPEELPEFNGAINGIPNVTEELPVVTYVSITAVPANAPIMDKPEYVEPHQPLSQRKLEENNSILLKHQFNKLRSLQTYCIANKKEFCYGIRHHYMAKNDIHDNLLGLRLGYGITNKLTLGGNIERSLEHHLSNNYRTLHNNVGIGAFVHYKLPSNSYIVAGIAKNNNSYLAPPLF